MNKKLINLILTAVAFGAGVGTFVLSILGIIDVSSAKNWSYFLAVLRLQER